MSNSEKGLTGSNSFQIDKLRTAWPTELIHTTAESIRKYYLSRIDLLRQIPYLALEADGRDGWNETFSFAYKQCCYPVHIDDGGYYDLVVELRTGLLATVDSYHDSLAELFPGQNISNLAGVKIAPDEDVLKVVGAEDDDLDELLLPKNLEEFVENLKEWATAPYSSCDNPSENEALKATFRIKLDTMMSAIPVKK